MPAPSMTPLIQSAWYVAALGSDIGDEPVGRRIVGRSIVLFRNADGAIAALDDRCPHRGFPLSAGRRLPDGRIECGYHGFVFDCSGACTSVPGQTAIPSRASANRHAAVEQGPFVWVWMGAPEGPAPSPLPGGTTLVDDGWTFATGSVPIACRQQLLIDNLMDLSHEAYIHATKIGTPEVAETPITTTEDDARHIVYASRRMESVTCPPSYQALGLSTPIDRWQDMEFHAPSLYVLRIRVAPAGSNIDDDATNGAVHLRVVYALTPVDDRNTHYFFAIGRDFELDNDELTRSTETTQYELIAEDAAAVELLQRLDESEGISSEVSIKIDTAGLAARRTLHALDS